MEKLIAVSFEEDNVKIVYATSKKKVIKVNDALTLKVEQFDDFLQKERAKEFIVTCDFKNFYQEIIFIPPVKSKYIKTLVKAEIRKRAPDFVDSPFVYNILGEKIVGNRKMQEVFVFAVKKNEIDGVINRFISKGKIVKSIYPNVLSLGSLLRLTEEPSLCILECNSYKNLFLVKNGKVQFIRTAQSIERGITDLDVKNINMTIHYCQQSLRTNPSNVMLLGSLSDSFNTTIPTVAPITTFPQPADIQATKEVFHEYVVPISSLFSQENITLLPYKYKSLYLIKRALIYSTAFLLLFSIVSAGYITRKLESIAEVKNISAPIKAKTSDIKETLSLYAQMKKELEKYAILLNFSKNISSAPDIQKLLISLSEITTTNIKISSLTITVNNNIPKTKIEGTITIEGYNNMQFYFQNFIDSINDIEGINVKNQNFSLGNKSFVVELD